MGNFVIYKSSAGSGKTFTLMKVYLSLILENPEKFRRILAITFTNKAANEIKSRILENLQKINRADKSVSRLVEMLAEETHLSVPEIRLRAERAHRLILHNYSDFAITTIDSFVYRVIRSFAFDLKISHTAEVEMETDLLADRIIDSLIMEVGKDDGLTRILTNFVEDRAEGEENWRIRESLAAQAKKLFDEETMNRLARMPEMDHAQIKGILNRIYSYMNEVENRLKSLAAQGKQIVDENDLAGKFAGGQRGLHSYFENILNNKPFHATQTSLKCLEDGKWYSSSATAEEKRCIDAVSGRLELIARELRDYQLAHAGRYTLFDLLQKNIYPLALLSRMARKLEQIKAEENIVPIGEFNKVLAQVVANEPVPFIYERLGERYQHILIDEFQDTSVMQWHNLLPLFENALSQNHLTMIVGDAKQAIYRFRNGDVDQFVLLPELRPQPGRPGWDILGSLLQRYHEFRRLETNYRSTQQVIEFNNAFFNYAAPGMLGIENDYYTDSSQLVHRKESGGYVTIDLLEKTEESSLRDVQLSRVMHYVNEALNDGYRYGDITVLCRQNSECADVAGYLSSRSVPVISADSLKVDISPEVIFLLNWFTLVQNPNDGIVRVAIAEYLLRAGKIALERAEAHQRAASGLPGFLQLLEDSDNLVSLNALESMSIYDMTEFLIRRFNLATKPTGYLRYYLDAVHDFSARNGSGIPAFLEYWKETGNKQSVAFSEKTDAVEILTIHKAKGLEYNIVIYPFIEGNNRLKECWLEVDDVLEGLPVASIMPKAEFEGTEYDDLYRQELLRTRLDNLNMAYVAFTRAVERLHLITGSRKPGNESTSLAGLLNNFAHGQQQPVVNGFIAFGLPGKKVQPDTEPSVAQPDTFGSYSWADRLVMARKAPSGVLREELIAGMQHGSLVHEALSRISTSQWEDYVLARTDLHPEQRDELHRTLGRVLHHPAAGRFFAGDCRTIMEKVIIDERGNSYRPDRINNYPDHTDVIDFKTGRPSEKHKRQVRDYAGLLAAMGYPDVKGWLLYIGDEIEIRETDR